MIRFVANPEALDYDANASTLKNSPNLMSATTRNHLEVNKINAKSGSMKSRARSSSLTVALNEPAHLLLSD